MNHPVPPLPDTDASQQAEYWLALRESPFFDDEQEQRWQAWLAASRENLEAWQQAQQFFNRVAALHPADVELIVNRQPPKSRAAPAATH
ncbi:FecR/PupR family sigma factor regulator, partial [Methylomonas rosea]